MPKHQPTNHPRMRSENLPEFLLKWLVPHGGGRRDRAIGAVNRPRELINAGRNVPEDEHL